MEKLAPSARLIFESFKDNKYKIILYFEIYLLPPDF